MSKSCCAKVPIPYYREAFIGTAEFAEKRDHNHTLALSSVATLEKADLPDSIRSSTVQQPHVQRES